MKKWILAVLCGALALGLAACGGQQANRQANGGFRGQQADLAGEVSAINGSNVTLKVMQFGGGMGNGAPGGMPSRRPNATRDPNATRPQFSRNPNASGAPFTRQYTGEEKTLTIPADAKITSTVFDNGNPAQVEMKLADLKVGDILLITYQQDKSTVASINVMSERNGN